MWVSPATARERLGEAFRQRMERALARAVTHHTLAGGTAAVEGVPSEAAAGLDPFAARADQFEGCEMDRETWLAYLADARELDLAELQERYG